VVLTEVGAERGVVEPAGAVGETRECGLDLT
jgi:hypothetical protein